jgi:hypothetical protein
MPKPTIKKIKKLYLVTPITLRYTEPLTDKEYKIELVEVKQEILRGEREFAYSVVLKEGKSKIMETLK